MSKAKKAARKPYVPTTLEQARDELFSHILRCGVLEAEAEHRTAWFDDTMDYLAERYEALTETELNELRTLGERYCRPVVRPEAATAEAGVS